MKALDICAIIEWHDALNEGKMLLRDIIDLDATYGGGPEGEVAEGSAVVEGEAGAEQPGPAPKGRRERPLRAKPKSLPWAPRPKAMAKGTARNNLAFRHGSGAEAAGSRNSRRSRPRTKSCTRFRNPA